MEIVDFIIHAKWIIPGNNQKILENSALVIDQGLIKDILSSSETKSKYQAKKIETFASHTLLPGFINSHTHIAMNYFRGLADDLALMDWLNNYIWPSERRWLSHEFVYDASLFAMAEMIRSGTTCFNDMYFFLDATAKAAELSGMRAHLGITVINFPTTWAQTFDEYVAKGLEVFKKFKNHPLIKFTIAPHAIYTVPEPLLMILKDNAEKYNLKINMHIHETLDEINASMDEFRVRPLNRLHKIGFLSPRLIAIHMVHINDEDLAILANTFPNIVHCPQSNMKLASGACPVNELKKIGLNIALGTDGAASNNDLNMIGEMRTASFLSKLTTVDPTSLSTFEALDMATMHGAKALGIENQTGSLSIGKSADFIAIDLNQIETLPHYHPLSQIIYASSRQQVTDVWVAGKQLMKDRKLLTLDEAAIKEKAAYWGNKLLINS